MHARFRSSSDWYSTYSASMTRATSCGDSSCAISSFVVGMSMPYTLQNRTGGAADATNTCFAPA